MKELLYVLFYQAIVAVNVAVILSAIIWFAKRKEEKDERKPNPDFTPPPEKKPEVELRSALIRTVNGEKFAQRWYAPDEQIPQYAILQGEPYKFFAEMDKDGGKLVEFFRMKPPTTGSAAIKPKYGISADEAARLVSKLAEASACLGGNSELDELRERVKDLADRLDRAEKKPVTTERMKEAGFEVEPVNIFNPAAESAEAYFLKIRSGIGNKVVDTVKMRCGSCRWHDDNGLCHCEAVCNPEKLPYYAAVKRPGDHLPCKHWGLGTITDNHGKELPAQTTHICKNCKHYLATDEEATVGLCGMKDEIAFGNSYRACFEKREGKDRERQNV